MSTFIFDFFKIGKDGSTAIIKNSFFIFFIYSIVFSKLSPVPSTRMSSDTELYNFDKGIELFIEDKFFIKFLEYLLPKFTNVILFFQN